MPDAATDTMGQNAPIVPAPQPPQDTTPPDIPSTGPAVPSQPPAIINSAAGTPKAPPLPKESFTEGITRESNPQYTTDAQGNIIRSEPARAPSKLGILGRILAGALEGAQRGIAAETPAGATGSGAAFSAGARAAREGKLAADKRARDIAQQNFLNKQAATQAKIKNNLDLAETMHLTQVMNFEKEQEPGILRAQKLKNDSAALQLEGQQDAMLLTVANIQKTLTENGLIDPKFLQFYNEHSPALTAQVSSFVSGDSKVLQNGQRGDKNGIIVVPTDIMRNTIIPKGTNLLYYTYDGAVDKSGAPIPTERFISGDGKATLLDYWNAAHLGVSQLIKMQQKTLADMTLEQHQAAVEESKAKSFHERASAEAELAAAGLGPEGTGDRTKTGEAYIATLPPINQDVVHGLVRYQMKPTDLGRSKDRKILIAETIHADPSWTEAQYEQRYNFLKEYGDTQRGAGATRDRINTAVGHLDMLSQASDALAGNDLKILNRVAQEFGVQTGNSARVVYDAIANKAASEAAAAMKGGGAAPTDTDIETARKSFDATLAPQTRKANIQAQYGLLKTQIDTVAGHFHQVMGQSPEEFGQPVLFPQNQTILTRWIPPAIGTIKTFPNGSTGKWDGRGWLMITPPQGQK